jgi:predicted ATPase/DNA-binding SARP family transcriptional activator
VEVRLLGPLDVVGDDGALITINGARLAALLARLAIDAGRVVPADRLVEDLYGEAPPGSPANALQGLASKLRRLLGRSAAIANRGGGYVLDLDPNAVDLVAFDRLTSEARAAHDVGDLQRARSRFEDALGLWRGPALMDFAYEEFAQVTITRADEARAAAVEDRVDVLLAQGEHHNAISELESLVAEHPLRERLRAQLMLALYRDGRQAEALRAYQAARAVLNDELGVDPGPELRRLEAAVLAQDASLDLPQRARAGATGGGRRSNIGTPLTPLVGRANELAELRDLVTARRLVTLTGPGGVGKTRLAAELGRALAGEFAGGVWLAELAALTDPADVPAAIVNALEVADDLTPPLARLVEYLRDRDVLLVLDNCEHVVGEAARVVAGMLGTSPRVRVLATSREPLRVAGETVWTTPPLRADEARELFAERASSADPSFVTDDSATQAISRICARLDGLPLAIELAAARARVFHVEVISARIDDRFRLLTGGERTALPRQQTLRAVVDWSYDLLFEDERRVFERLSLFAGPCSLPAAEAVCSGEDVAGEDVAEILARLVDKSLVNVDRGPRGTRYWLLQTLAQYGRDRLEATGETDLLRARHTAYYVALTGLSERAVHGEGQHDWILSVRADIDDLRAAMSWAIDRGSAADALTLSGGLAWYWVVDGGVPEGFRWMEASLALDGPVAPSIRAHALMWACYLAMVHGAHDAYRGHRAEALEAAAAAPPPTRGIAMVFLAALDERRGDRDGAIALCRAGQAALARVRDPWVVPWQGMTRGLQLYLDGRWGDARDIYAAAAGELRAAGNRFEALVCLRYLGGLAETVGDYPTAATAVADALSVVSELGSPFRYGALMFGTRLGNIAMLMGDLDDADARLTAAIAGLRGLGHPGALAVALNAFAQLRRRQGRIADARAAATEALDRCRESGTHGGLEVRYWGGRADALALVNLGFAAEQDGDPDAATRWHREALAQAAGSNDRAAMAVAAEGLAGAAALAGDALRAARLMGAAEATRSAIGRPVGPGERFDVDRIEATMRALSDPAAIEAAREAGVVAGIDAATTG